MSIMLNRSGIAEDLMTNLAKLFRRMRGGIAIAVVFIGVLLAASTGIIGAAVVLLAILGVPLMLKHNYSPQLACGVVWATGTLGILIHAWIVPGAAPAPKDAEPVSPRLLYNVVLAIIPTAGLIFLVLRSIFFGIATPTEASGVGALGATLLALARGRLSIAGMRDVVHQTTKTTSYIFALFVGATAFSLVLRGLGGDEVIESALTGLPFGP